MIKKIIFTLLLLAFATGIFFYVRFQQKLYNAILVTQIGASDVVNFLKTAFPNQVAEYQAKQNAQNKSALPATNPAPAPTK